MALSGARQLAKQGAEVAAAKRVDQGRLSDTAVAEQLELDALKRRLMVGRRDGVILIHAVQT